MRNQFAAYLPKKKRDFEDLWEAALFTFDTNILLALYEATSEFNETFFASVKTLGDRTFLTHQVALEFYRRRQGIIRKARQTFSKLPDSVSSIPAAFSAEEVGKLKSLLEELNMSVSSFLTSDPIEQTLNDLFKNRVGPPEKNILDLYKQIDLRYALEIPPGFADVPEKNDFRKYGDAVLWLQTIEYAKQTQKPIILITSETKRDWWQLDNKGLPIGPRPELGAEMFTEAGVDFYLYSLSSFIEHAASHLKAKPAQPPQESAKEIERIERKRVESSQEDELAALQSQWRLSMPDSSTYSPALSGHWVDAQGPLWSGPVNYIPSVGPYWKSSSLRQIELQNDLNRLKAMANGNSQLTIGLRFELNEMIRKVERDLAETQFLITSRYPQSGPLNPIYFDQDSKANQQVSSVPKEPQQTDQEVSAVGDLAKETEVPVVAIKAEAEEKKPDDNQ